MAGWVLVLTQEVDATADVVIEELNQRDTPVVRSDLNGMSVAAELIGSRWIGHLGTTTRTVRLEEVLGVYYRRPSRPSAREETDTEVRAWVEAERRWGLGGLLVALPRDRWLNWSPAVQAAEYKPWQLSKRQPRGWRCRRPW